MPIADLIRILQNYEKALVSKTVSHGVPHVYMRTAQGHPVTDFIVDVSGDGTVPILVPK